jgi:hypothetical protein
MKRNAIVVAMVLMATPAWAAGPITGEYVEARTAEVFAGGCIMSSEAETIGRQAVLAWRIGEGTYMGQQLDGLQVVAAVTGDRNLGIREIGGEAPSYVRAAVLVDERATTAQRDALVRLARELSRGLITEVVSVTAVPISFDSGAHQVAVNAGAASLKVTKHLHHDPACGAMKWFTPFSVVDRPELGLAVEHAFSGRVLDTRWSAPNRKSAFFGTFNFVPEPPLSN